MTSSRDAHAATGNRPAPPTPMIDVETLAELWSVSTRHIRRLVDAGHCPPPVRLGRCVRWPRPVIEKWIAEGCPSCRVLRRKEVTR